MHRRVHAHGPVCSVLEYDALVASSGIPFSGLQTTNETNELLTLIEHAIYIYTLHIICNEVILLNDATNYCSF